MRWMPTKAFVHNRIRAIRIYGYFWKSLPSGGLFLRSGERLRSSAQKSFGYAKKWDIQRIKRHRDKKSKNIQKTLYKCQYFRYYRQAVRETGWDRTLKTEQIHVRFIWKHLIDELNISSSHIQWRVWSWLRMNAGGVPNTCKSNESSSEDEWRTGE